MHQNILKAILALQKTEPGCDDKLFKGLTEEQRFLLEMIRRCLIKSPLPSKHRKKINLSPSKVSDLFLRILAADCTKKEAGAFLAQLFYNDHFYSALHPLLQTATLPTDADDSNLHGFKMLPDEELLKIVLSMQPKKYRALEDAPSLAHRFQDAFSKTAGLKSYAFAAVALLSMALLLSLGRRPNAVYIAYFETPPKPYYSDAFSPAGSESYRSSLRSSAPTAGNYQDADILELNTQLKVGLADYLAKDYHSAIAQFQTLEKTAESPDSSAEFFAWKQQYYFYYGMAHLGLTGGKTFRRAHLRKAAKYLECSLLAEEPISPQAPDDVRFFLGLAYALAGDADGARNVLQPISDKSPFYIAASELTINKNSH